MVGILLEITKIIFVLILCYGAMLFFIGGWKVIFADKATYKRNHMSTAGFLNAIKGTIPTRKDGTRTHNVVAGLAYDVKEKKVIPQGTLSNESIESILR